jgi:molybdopterin converting factor small subunit
MRVTFKLFATLQDYLPEAARRTNALQLEIDEGATVQQVIERFSLPQEFCKLVLVDGCYIAPAERAACVLRDGATLAIWPPIAGG